MTHLGLKYTTEEDFKSLSSDLAQLIHRRMIIEGASSGEVAQEITRSVMVTFENHLDRLLPEEEFDD